MYMYTIAYTYVDVCTDMYVNEYTQTSAHLCLRGETQLTSTHSSMVASNTYIHMHNLCSCPHHTLTNLGHVYPSCFCPSQL